MTIRSDFINKLRVELNDLASTNPIWSDDLLLGFVADAYSQLSLDVPSQTEVFIPAVAGQRDYTMGSVVAVAPAGIISVQYPAGYLVPPGNTSQQYFQTNPLSLPTTQTTWQPFTQCWEFLDDFGFQQVLRFRYPTNRGGQIVVRCYTPYQLVAHDDDDLQMNPFYETALKWASCERALSWLEELRAKRQGGTVGGSRGTARYYHQLYQNLVSQRQRLHGRTTQLVVDG